MEHHNRGGDEGTLEKMGEQFGRAAGRAIGRGSDMAAGMFGGLLGSAVDKLGDWWTSPDAERAASSFGEHEDRSCREHFEVETSADIDRSYDDARPLYQFGHTARQSPDFQGRQFDDVERDLERAWEGGEQKQGEWPEVRGYVGFGYTQDNPDAPRDF